MRIKIKDIPDAGLDLELPYGRPLLEDALAGTDADLDRTRGHARLRLEHVGENVFVRGQVTGAVTLPCGRCLKAATVDVDVPVRMTFTPPGERPADDDPVEDVDFAAHDGEQVELGPLLRESFILSVPMSPLCREGCLGLCPVCGKDRNVAQCGCNPHIPDPRLAALKDIKL